MRPGTVVTAFGLIAAVAQGVPTQFYLMIRSSYAAIDYQYISAKTRSQGVGTDGSILVSNVDSAAAFSLNTTSNRLYLTRTSDNETETAEQTVGVRQGRVFFGTPAQVTDGGIALINCTAGASTAVPNTQELDCVSQGGLSAQYACIGRYAGQPTSSGWFLGGSPVRGKAKCGDIDSLVILPVIPQ